MSLFRKISEGLKVGFRFKRVALYVVLFQFLLSGFIAVLSYNFVQGPIGHSTNLMKIMEAYNHDVFQDLLRFESTGWRMIKTFGLTMVFIYLLAGPFILGGLMNAWDNEKDNWESFWYGGSKYYFSFLKISLLILLVLLIGIGLLSFLAVSMINYGMAQWKTEVSMLIFLSLILLLAIILITILVSTSTIAKAMLVRGLHEKTILRTILKAFKVVWNKMSYFIYLGLSFLVLSIGFMLASNLLINLIPESTLALVVIAFLLQLLFLYVKVCLRHGYYRAILNFDS